MSLFGMQGKPLKIDKLGYMGTTDEVIEQLKELSKGKIEPVVIRLNDTIAVFDIHVDLKPKLKIEEFEHRFHYLANLRKEK